MVSKVLDGKEKAYCLHWQPEGQMITWCYLLVPLTDEKRLLEDWDSDKRLQLEDYGEVIFWGQGNIPEDIKNEMKTKYGF